MDVVVTVPKGRWAEWLAEGGLPGEPLDPDLRFDFELGGRAWPEIDRGERVYVVSHGRLRGYAPLSLPVVEARGRAAVPGVEDGGSEMTQTRWKAPAPPPGKANGPEGRAGWIVDLWASGDEKRAREVAALPLKGGKKAGGKPVPPESAYVGVDPALDGGGSMNWAPAMAAAHYVALAYPPAARSWLLAYADRRHPLWRRETLSQTYGWILHHFAAVLRAAHDRGDRELEDAFRDLLRRHVALLMSLRWRFPGARKLSGYDEPVISAGERSPHGRLNGKRLTTFLACCLHVPDATPSMWGDAGDDLRKAQKSGAPTGWPERSLLWSHPYERGTSMTAVEAARILREDVRLAATLEVGRLPNGDGWTRLLSSYHQSTAPTLATSVLGGRLYCGGVHPPGAREGLGRGHTEHVEGRIHMWTKRSDTGETLESSIPAPPVAGAEVWHVGPGGWREGAAR